MRKNVLQHFMLRVPTRPYFCSVVNSLLKCYPTADWFWLIYNALSTVFLWAHQSASKRYLLITL